MMNRNLDSPTQAFEEAQACAEYFRALRENNGPLIALSGLTGPGSSLTLGGQGLDLTSVPVFTKVSAGPEQDVSGL